ncbi:MAG: glycerophosphodiester phosphodiesterase family protein, partial [Oscillospiraceae bacterium]
YISTENIKDALLNPLAILAVFMVLLLFTAYTIFEISFLTLTFNQCYQKKTLGFFRMLGVSLSDAVRVIQPKNYILILLTMVVIPVSNSLMVSSFVGGVTVPNYIMEVIVGTPLYLTGVLLLLLALLVLIIRYVFVFHVYTLEDKTVIGAAKEAVILARGKRMKSLLVFAVWQLIWYFAIGVISVLIYLGLTQLAISFVENESVYAILLTVNTTVRDAMSFIIPAILVVSGYSMISSLFFTFREESDKELPEALQPRTPLTGKKNLHICLFAVAVCFIATVGISYSAAHMSQLQAEDPVLVMAHRGNSVGVPENSLPAFQKAIDLGADYIELDVQETKDGAIVVTHDSNFVRCTGVDYNVWEHTLSEIQKLDAGVHFGMEYKGTRIPTLEEVLAQCKGKIRMNIELKSNGHERSLEKSVAELITQSDSDQEVVITSLTKKCLVNFKKYKPKIPCGYIVSMAVGNYLDVPWSDFYSVEQSFITKQLIYDAHKRGKTINAWTPDTAAEIENLITLGVDSVITGDPLLARGCILAHRDPLTHLLYAIGDVQ